VPSTETPVALIAAVMARTSLSPRLRLTLNMQPWDPAPSLGGYQGKPVGTIPFGHFVQLSSFTPWLKAATSAQATMRIAPSEFRE
jgi:hypothetical protein